LSRSGASALPERWLDTKDSLQCGRFARVEHAFVGIGKISSMVIDGLIFDGQTLRIEFGVTRFDAVKANTAFTGRRSPAAGWCCRRQRRSN
jgi:hypothetical protein